MLLVGFTLLDVVLGVMWASLGILVIIILYRFALRRMSAGSIDKRNFCVLYELDVHPVKGEVKIYFTSEMEREARIIVYDQKMEPVRTLIDFRCKVGGNIVNFDSTLFSDGNYFYGLETENQKVLKKMRIENNLA